MTRRNKLIILASYLLMLTVALSLYSIKRNATDRRLQAEIRNIESEMTRINAATLEMGRLQRLLPAKAETMPFIEALYSAAKESGMSTHEVTTDSEVTRSATRGAAVPTSELATHCLRIRAEGSFRSIAEYIRRVQNIERLKSFTDIKLSSGKQSVLTSLTIELYSLKGQNAR